MAKPRNKIKNMIFPPETVLPPGTKAIGPVDPEHFSLAVSLARMAEQGSSLLVNVPDALRVERLLAELPMWFRLFGRDDLEVMALPEGRDLTGHSAAESDSPRTFALSRLLTNPPPVVLASVISLFSPSPKPETMQSASFLLKTGEEIPMQELAERLVKLDYDDETQVTVPGEFARRGGLIDIYSFSESLPARIEFFGDEIESIRLFDPATQLTTEKVAEYHVVLRSGGSDPMLNDGSPADYFQSGNFRLLQVFPGECAGKLKDYTESERVQERLAEYERFIQRFAESGFQTVSDAVDDADHAGSSYQIPCYPVAGLIRAGLTDDAAEGASLLQQQWNREIINRWLSAGVCVTVAGRTEADLVHIRQWMAEAEIKGVQLKQMELPFGIYLPKQKLAFLTGNEVYGLTAKTAPRRRSEHANPENLNMPDSADTAAFADLEEGDYAVHIQHGICIYRGLETIRSGGAVAEMIALEFDDGARMHVPLWQAHCVTKYIGSKKTIVHLNKLASSKWGKTRAAAARSVQALAYGMLRMQAVRGTVHSRPYPPDGLDQKLFEEAFPFRETADQLRAAEEIKQDMEQGRPMDRLLCGDVGFGKTELAMRAAFKAVSAGRQVAVLVPTTVLAQQHYYSFLERFSGTPVLIEQLSRFRTKGQQAEILKRLKEGTLDIVIGTHRLVQEDVRFRDLGLIIIDEEQRFGVEHKDRLKRLRVTADVLTMTATPIPRTLYLSMAGMRDLSTIMSAPVQRLPIRTVVAKNEDSVIRSAIGRELERGGQVYYLHNRVATIDEEAAKLHEMFPEARIGIGHGKMNEHELEEIMSRFIEGKLDILVCTTIVESGLDIPNANTIIIDRADRFGLAELYQLRGRVGRWTRQAYAYMLLPKSGILTGDARKRISAIRSYTHLGAGFKLAMRDLEIRGSGNILGAEQSGQINAIGFHLYCELLRSCVAQIKGESLEVPPETELFMDFLVFASEAPEGKIAACFPDSCINAGALRIDAYRRLAAVATEKRLDDFEAELRDRYGKLPDSAKYLLDSARIRILAAQQGISSIECRDNRIYCMTGDGSYLKPGGLVPRLNPADSPAQKLQCVLTFLRSRKNSI